MCIIQITIISHFFVAYAAEPGPHPGNGKAWSAILACLPILPIISW